MLGNTAGHPESLYQAIFEKPNPEAGFHENEPLIIDALNTDRYLTFADLRSKVRAFAAALLGPSFGLKQGDVAIVCSPNDIDYYVAFHGIVAAGCVSCNLRPVLSAEEIAQLLRISEPKLVIAHPDTIQRLQDAMVLYGMQLPMIVMATTEAPPNTRLLSDFLQQTDDNSQQQPLPRISSDAACHLLCTSGTTGAFKLVTGSHASEVWRTIDQAEVIDKEALGTNAITVLTCGNFGSSHNIVHSLQGWLYGRCRQYVTDSMDENMILRMMHKYRCITPNLLPSHVATRLINNISKMPLEERLDLASSFKLIRGCGQPMDPKVIQRASEVLPGVRVQLIFGSTECLYKFLPTTDGIYRIYDNGSTRENDDRFKFKLVDEHGRPVPRGCQGELLFKSPMVFKGYFNNPEKTAEAFDEDGYFRTGDIFVVDENNRATWLGRASERIKAYSTIVVPKPIEDLCMAFGGIKECAVVGAFSKKRVYELPTAFIVPEEGNVQDPQALAAAVAQYVNDRVPADEYRLDGGVKVIDALPRTSVGKVNRFKLRGIAQNEVE